LSLDAAIQASIAASSEGCHRSPTCTPLPVGAGPRFFFGTIRVFAINRGTIEASRGETVTSAPARAEATGRPAHPRLTLAGHFCFVLGARRNPASIERLRRQSANAGIPSMRRLSSFPFASGQIDKRADCLRLRNEKRPQPSLNKTGAVIPMRQVRGRR
jgi:hypothetical protein